VKINYSGDKRRRELALKQRKEDKAKRLAERRAMKSQQPDGDEFAPQSDESSSDDLDEPETDSSPDETV
jgi:hypothetical protein